MGSRGLSTVAPTPTRTSGAYTTVHFISRRVARGGVGQRECWAPFCVAGYGLTRLLAYDGRRAEDILIQGGVGAKVRRTVELEEDGVLVRAKVDPACGLGAAFFFVRDAPRVEGMWDCVHCAPECGYSRSADRIIAKADEGLLETWLPCSVPARDGVQ